MFKNKEFVVDMTGMNYKFVRWMISEYYIWNPIGHAGGKGIFDSNILVKAYDDNHVSIWFRCRRHKANVCRHMLDALYEEEKIEGYKEF